MEKVKVKVTITDAVQPPGEPVITLRVPKGGKAVFRRKLKGRAPAAGSVDTVQMNIPISRVEDLRTLGYLVGGDELEAMEKRTKTAHAKKVKAANAALAKAASAAKAAEEDEAKEAEGGS